MASAAPVSSLRVSPTMAPPRLLAPSLRGLPAACALALLFSLLAPLVAGDNKQRKPPQERGGLVVSQVPNTQIALGGWAQYADYYYVQGTSNSWVAGPADQCYCLGWAR